MVFSLPLWRESAEEPSAGADEISDQIEGPSSGPLVLIVEDDAIFRRYLRSLLHVHGYRTVEARHAEGGWVLARRLRPSVVLLDFALSCPEGATVRTGWDLAERLAGDDTTRHVPIVFVTGFDDELRERIQSTAFSRRPEHLVKPIDAFALIGKIESVLDSAATRVVRVLMVDDDPSVTAYVRRTLSSERYHIESASNGDECLHILRSQPRGFDLLLLDLMMPDVSGYDVLREMTLTGVGRDLPVLVLTNFPEGRNDEERRLLEKGIVLDVLPKTSVHDQPELLPHVIEWHLHVARDGRAANNESESEAA
jgi:CheY-like chemotaxis protein